MKLSLPAFAYQIIGFLGLVTATLIAVWLLTAGDKESNQIFTISGYVLAVVGITPALLIINPPLNKTDGE